MDDKVIQNAAVWGPRINEAGTKYIQTITVDTTAGGVHTVIPTNWLGKMVNIDIPVSGSTLFYAWGIATDSIDETVVGTGVTACACLPPGSRFPEFARGVDFIAKVGVGQPAMIVRLSLASP